MAKVLVINGSLNKNGNCSKIIDKFTGSGADVKVINAYTNDKKFIKPCMDCGGCTKVPKCVINDEFDEITSDFYDTVVVISPIYMSNLTGPMFNLISRFNYLYNNEACLGVTHDFKAKRGIIVLVGGGGQPSKKLMGESNEDLPIKQAKYILKKLNASVDMKDIIMWLDSDESDFATSGTSDKIEKISESF